LFIKFVAKVVACAMLAGIFSSAAAMAQEATPPATSNSAQSQSQTGSQPATTDQTQSGQNQGSASGQQKQDQNTNDKANNNSKDQQNNAGGKVEGTSNDRLFYALPNFLTLQAGQQLPPLSAKDKFKVVALGTFDYVNIPWWGAIAAASQAEDNEPAFGQGWKAYAERYGSTAADSIIENFMVGAVFPALIHQDPRFYYSSNGGIVHRTGYALSRIMVSRSDSGKRMFNFSEIIGAATAAAISTYTYHPGSTCLATATYTPGGRCINNTPSSPHEFIDSNHTFVNAAEVWGTQIGLDSVTLVIKEFWPDIHKAMAKKKAAKAAAAQSNQ
jgi:hypothetical protein